MTGAPKLRAMEILEQLEGTPRGVYSGALGLIGWDGAIQLNIVIRTAVVTASEIVVGAGGAIVALSDPEAELRELLLKLEPVVVAAAHSAGVSASTARRRLWDLAEHHG